MKITKTKLNLLLIALGFSINSLFSSADASTYGKVSTRVSLSERFANPGGNINGEYFTQASGRSWVGNLLLKPNPRGNGGGRQNYVGTFSDFTTGPAKQLTCTGDVIVSIATGLNRSNQKEMTIEWTAKGGQGCPNLGQKRSLTLPEALPIPNINGDFMIQNANGWNGGTQDSTWGRWRVVDKTLNCRSTPNGTIQKTYKNGDVFDAKIERSGNAIVGSNGKDYPFIGSPWLRTKDSCYVRANSQFIQPASTPY